MAKVFVSKRDNNNHFSKQLYFNILGLVDNICVVQKKKKKKMFQ